jgi:hypothetical protein
MVNRLEDPAPLTQPIQSSALPPSLHAIFEEPIIAGISESTERVVGCHSVASPSRECNSKILDIASGRREVDTIDEGVDRVVHGLHYTSGVFQSVTGQRCGRDGYLAY